MTNSLPAFTTQQFFAACKKLLGISFLSKLFLRSNTTIYKWCADPIHNEETRRNPPELIQILMRELAIRGREDIAVSAMNVLANELGYRLQLYDEVMPDKDDLAEECLDDHRPMVVFHEAAIDLETPMEMVRYLAEKAKQEIDETVTAAEIKRKQ